MIKKDFISRLANADWSTCFYSTDANPAWISFKNVFTSVLDSVAPVKELRLRNQSEPWINSEILDSIKQTKRLVFI
jgi:hypothetical protein